MLFSMSSCISSQHTIPTYFDNQIIFASFIRKLHRWGFKRVPSSRTWYYEFCSPTFKRLGPAPAAAAAAALAMAAANTVSTATAAANKTPSAARGGDSVVTNPANIQPQQVQEVASPLPQVVRVSQADAIAAALLSNMQRNNQQPLFPSQNSVALNSIPQGNVDWRIHPNPATNHLLYNVLNTSSTSAQQIGDFHHSHQSNLMSLSETLSALPTFPNTGTTSMPQVIQSLLELVNRIKEEDRQLRAQADAIQIELMATVGRITAILQGETSVHLNQDSHAQQNNE